MDNLMHSHNAVKFHDDIAKDWVNNYKRRSFKKRFNLFKQILRSIDERNQKWLDLGCGAGVLSLELLRLGCSVDALDGSISMVESARAYISEHDYEMTITVSDVNNLSWLSSGVYDGVLCSSVIEYVENPDAVMLEINRVLKPNGKLIISIPPTNSIVRRLQKNIKWIALLAGIRIFDYMNVSKYEIDMKSQNNWFQSLGFIPVSRTPFDALIPTPFFLMLPPALWIFELKKTACS